MRLLFGLSVAMLTLIALAAFHDSRLSRTDPTQPQPVPVARTTQPRAQRSRPLHTEPPSRLDVLDWKALAMCESSNNPRAISPDGLYRGLFQFDRETWESVGGHGNPAQASRVEQQYRAKLLYARRGREPWPICGGRL